MLLLEAEPTRDTSLCLSSLLSHGLVEGVSCFLKFPGRVILSLLELFCSICLELVKLGISLVRLLTYLGVRYV